MSGFKIATYNANSIRVRLPQILDWLTRENPDVLCVQETKVQDKDFPLQAFQDAGYHVVFRGQKSHAGVCIISRSAPESSSAGFGDEVDAPRLLRGMYRGIAVVNTYVPQGRDVESDQFQYKLQWFAQIRTLFETAYTPEQPVVWVGDFNVATQDIDVYNPTGLRGHVDFHPAVQTALENVRAWGFVDVFRKHHPDEPGHYSYWDYRAHDPIDRGVGWRIDHIWATPTLAEKSVQAWIDVDARRVARASDHTFMVAEFAW